MKRKALVILTVAILAFAMIPALGAGAAAGQIKIVTPDQLANPSGTTGSTFERLTSAKYVTTAIDEDDTTLAGTSSTLQVVIDDDDKEANTLSNYYAIYDSVSGNTFNVRPGTGTGNNPSRIANADNRLLDAADLTDAATPITDPAPDPDDDEAGDLIVGNRDRSGGVDASDIVVQVGHYATPAVAEAGDENQREKVTFTPTTTYTSSLFIATTQDDEGDIVAVQLRTTDITLPTGVTGTPALRITFASAKHDDLNYEKDHRLEGQSRVEVSSTSGDRIRVSAGETDITGLAGAQTDGVNGMELSEAESKDSGTFVGIFGIIDYDWKRMIETWATDDQGPDAVAGQTNTTTFEVVAAAGDAVEEGNVELVDSDSDTGNLSATSQEQITFDLVVPTPEAGYVITGTPTAAGTFPAVTTSGSERPAGSVDIDSQSWDAATSTLTVTVADLADVPATDPLTNTDVVVTADDIAQVGDTLVVTYNITATFATLKRELDVDEVALADRHDALENLVDRDDKDHASALSDALQTHVTRLNLSDSSHATAVVNALLGVRHGDNVTVQYADKSGGSSVNSTRVDSMAPTIGGLDPANGSFTTDPTFDMLFTVTDDDSGIKEDADTKNVRPGVRDVSATASATFQDGSSTGTTYVVTPDEEDDVSDGYIYEMRVDAGNDSLRAEKLEPPQNLKVRIDIIAYDIARNMETLTVLYEVDTIDPELTGALLGWSVKSDSDVDRDNDPQKTVNGAHVLVEDQPNSMVLIFNGPIDGSSIRASQIAIGGATVETVTWLDNKAANVISVGTLTVGDGTDNDLDFDADTDTSSNARDDVGDSNTAQPAGMGLNAITMGQDARHLLFLTLEGDVPTDARFAVGIDNDDVLDLAGNRNRSDHSLARASDRVAPRFTVTVDPDLSNSGISITITASESLDRPPTVRVGEKTVSARPSGSAGWTVDESLSDLGFRTKGQDDGVYTVTVEGLDEDGNEGTSTKGKWELDTRANKGEQPTRGGVDADDGTKTQAALAQSLETNEVVFLNVNFDAEGDEYGTGTGDAYKSTDTEAKVTITGLSLETLAANAIAGKPAKLAANPTVETTADIDAASAQTSNGVKHVVALSELSIGNYRLNVSYSDAAGNTGKFGYVFKIIAPKPAEVSVVPGWSLISIPGTPQDLSIGGVLEGSTVTDVWSLNNETKVWEFARHDENGEWMGTLTQMVDGRAYFVRSTTFDPIKVLTERFSPQRTPSQYIVTAGWNGIGYTPAGNETEISVDGYLSSLGTSGWGMVRTWNADDSQYETYYSSGAMTDGFPTTSTDLAKVEEGKGYLLFATRNGVIGG